jgi:hypothetical protein
VVEQREPQQNSAVVQVTIAEFAVSEAELKQEEQLAKHNQEAVPKMVGAVE